MSRRSGAVPDFVQPSVPAILAPALLFEGPVQVFQLSRSPGAGRLSRSATIDQADSRGRRGGGPQLFVIVASTGRADQLDEGLTRLLPVARSLGALVVVVGAATPNRVYALTQRHTGVRYIMAAPGLSRTDLLSRGVEETGGGVVVLTDDDGLASEDWDQLLPTRLGLSQREHHGQAGIPA